METSLAMAIMRSHSCALAVHCCRVMTLAPFIPFSFNDPIWSLLFLLPQQWRECSLLKTSKPIWTLKYPPYSYCSSKDIGYIDCQLRVPTRPISSQRKIDVSKGNTEESAVLWRVLKYFMPLDYNTQYLYLAFGDSFWRANCYLKGSYSPARCQMLELSAIWWCCLINLSRVPFNNGHHNHSCRSWDWE